jgi:hypothetical protein
MSWLSKAAKKAAGQVQDAWDGAEDAWEDTQDAAEDAADEAKKIGKKLLNGLDDVAASVKQILDPYTIGIRGLRHSERDILHRVYKTSLPPLNNILILSLAGVSGRPFALPASFVAGVASLIVPGGYGLLLALVALAAKRGECYFLFMGRSGYNNAITGFPGHDDRPGQTLVHEACHVWQGYQRMFTWEYIFDSIFNQCFRGGAYQLPDPPTESWDYYGAEQQGIIVERWFADGEQTDGAYYPYIHSNVRPGKPHAATYGK